MVWIDSRKSLEYSRTITDFEKKFAESCRKLGIEGESARGA